jgi:hypothetical protein
MTERLTSPEQIKKQATVFREGIEKDKGYFLVANKVFQKGAKITEEEYAQMDPTLRRDILVWENEWVEKLTSEDANERALAEWVRAELFGHWLFVVDGNSR